MQKLGWLLALLFVVASGWLSCTEDGEKEEVIRECVTDEECGPGYNCRLQECVPNVQEGECYDDEDCPSGYVCNDELVCVWDDGSVDDDDDDDTVTDGDTPEDGDLDGDDEEDPAEDGDLEDDEDGDAEYEEGELDPRCVSQSNFGCRENTVFHDVFECANGDLNKCSVTWDPSYPQCGYQRRVSYWKTCQEECLSAEDPNDNDYCAEDGPVEEDGDVEPADGDTESDQEIATSRNGDPCQVNGDCASGHCKVDWDGEGRYCSPAIDMCVDHVDEEEGESALFYQHGKIVCHETMHKRCSTGAWVMPIECAPSECTSGYLYREAQTCVTELGCQPQQLPAHEPCAGHYACFDEYNCRGTCSDDNHCAPEYSCVNGHCE